MRNGEVIDAEIAHKQDGVVTVRFATEPYTMPGNYGLQTLTFKYLDVKQEYIRE